MCFSRRVWLLLIVITAGISVSAETRKPIYRIRRYCNAMSEYSPIWSIGLTLLRNLPVKKNSKSVEIWQNYGHHESVATFSCLHYLNLDLKHICSPPSMLLNCPVRQRLWSHGNMALYKFCIVLYGPPRTATHPNRNRNPKSNLLTKNPKYLSTYSGETYLTSLQTTCSCAYRNSSIQSLCSGHC